MTNTTNNTHDEAIQFEIGDLVERVVPEYSIFLTYTASNFGVVTRVYPDHINVAWRAGDHTIETADKLKRRTAPESRQGA